MAASNTARFSTEVAPHGMQITMRGFEDGALLNGRDAAGNADDNTRTRGEQALLLAAGLADEIAQHRLGHVEVGDDAIPHRLDGLDVSRSAAKHALRIGADRQDTILVTVDGDN